MLLIYRMVCVCPPGLSGTTESRRCWSGSDRQTDVPRYLSEERCLALRLCGWISRGPDIDVEIFLRTLEQEREWERAAAVALFNLDIRRAIQILNKGATAEKGECCISREWRETKQACLWRQVLTGRRIDSEQTHNCTCTAWKCKTLMFFQTDIHLYELLFVQIADHFLDKLVHCLVYKTSRKILKNHNILEPRITSSPTWETVHNPKIIKYV